VGCDHRPKGSSAPAADKIAPGASYCVLAPITPAESIRGREETPDGLHGFEDHTPALTCAGGSRGSWNPRAIPELKAKSVLLGVESQFEFENACAQKCRPISGLAQKCRLFCVFCFRALRAADIPTRKPVIVGSRKDVDYFDPLKPKSMILNTLTVWGYLERVARRPPKRI
jgi:hypothetical protein